MLAPGAVIPPFWPAGSVIISVERGTVVVDGERIAGEATSSAVMPISSGTAVALAPDAGATIRNVGDGPALLLILTIAPVGPAAGTKDPGASTT